MLHSTTPQADLLSILARLSEASERGALWHPAVAAVVEISNASMGQLLSSHPLQIHALAGLDNPCSGTSLPPGAASSKVYELRAAGLSLGQLTLFFGPGHSLDPAAEPLVRLSCGVLALALHANSKSQEMATLVQGAAHDLRGAVVRAATFSELLSTSADSSLETREVVMHLKASVAGLEPFIRDLVTYASIDTLPAPAPLALQAVFDSVCWQTSRIIAARQAILTFAGGPGLMVVAHEADLADALQRLIGNSLKFGPEKPVITISSQLDGDHILLTVQDNGPGIEAAYQEKVFHLFQRLHGKQIPGHGLGLAICRKYVQLLGGQISLETGQGLTVVIRLPAHSQSVKLSNSE